MRKGETKRRDKIGEFVTIKKHTVKAKVYYWTVHFVVGVQSFKFADCDSEEQAVFFKRMLVQAIDAMAEEL